jgi:beta-lactamase regulating signal transducer with metallopeptidase domain
MTVLIGIALKSLIIAGLTLGLLKLMAQRSAAERSWVAHIGLLALVVLAFAPLVLPSWNIEAPGLFGQTPALAPVAAPVEPVAPTGVTAATPAPPAAPAKATSSFSLSTAAAATVLYALPAAVLLFITFLALARLVALRARADVLVDGHWLSALARAQRRMGFKHGTALLTSDDLASPISWGLMRPVILLNSRAVEASGEAEAIIAHELAHVARMDWVKLLLARVATALFWFNPLVWILAREAHQLREESADDAVLAADIADTDYAELLVGVARHECPGLLLGAHGVAPSKSSLARRVARVLDGSSVRGPVARSFALGVLVGAVLIAAPLAALTLTPKKAPNALAGADTSKPYYSPSEPPADLAHVIASGVTTAVTAARQQATVISQDGSTISDDGGKVTIRSASGKAITIDRGKTVLHGQDGKTVTFFPADSSGRRRVVVTGPQGTVVSYADPSTFEDFDFDFDFDLGPGVHGPAGDPSAIGRAAALKAVGASPAYVAAVRAAAPGIRLSQNDFVQFAAVGVTPDYVRELVRAGYPRLRAEDIVQARAVGITSDYARAMAAAGYSRISISDLVQLRAVGVTPTDVNRFRKAGRRLPSVDDMVKAKTLGLDPSDIEPDDPDG